MYKSKYLFSLYILLTSSILAYAEAPPANVVVSSFTEQTIAENTKMTGVLQFERVSGVSSEISGLIDQVFVKSGDRIKQNEKLFSLNVDFIENELQLKQTIIEQLEFKLKQTEKNLVRIKKLFEKNAVSEAEYDDLFYTFHALQKNLENKKIDLDRTLLKKQKSTITSPFDGLILEKNVDSGDWVQQGTIICKVGSLKDLIVNLPVGETALKNVRQGEKMDVLINALGQTVSGTLSGVMPVADKKTKNISLKISLPVIEGAIENMSATVNFPLSIQKKLKLISRDALVKHQGQDFIYAVKEGKATLLPVNVVLYQGVQMGIDNQDIENDLKIIVNGNERLQPDQPVIITGEI